MTIGSQKIGFGGQTTKQKKITENLCSVEDYERASPL